ncbi:hypothetical protein LTR27_009652 [Elasticomyces elasticus]|nr:hypothetical protein LTR27_009652 [Elasticomyces elasticus]
MATSAVNSPFEKLPSELLLVVAGYLNIRDLLQLSQTTKLIYTNIRTHETSIAKPLILAQQERARFHLDALDLAGLEIIPALRRLSSVLDTSKPLNGMFVQKCFETLYSHPSNPKAKRYTYRELQELARTTYTHRHPDSVSHRIFRRIAPEIQAIQLAAHEEPFWPSGVIWSNGGLNRLWASVVLDQSLVSFLGFPAPTPGKTYVCRKSETCTPLWEAVQGIVANRTEKTRCPGAELMKAKMLELIQILPARTIPEWHGV